MRLQIWLLACVTRCHMAKSRTRTWKKHQRRIRAEDALQSGKERQSKKIFHLQAVIVTIRGHVYSLSERNVSGKKKIREHPELIGLSHGCFSRTLLSGAKWCSDSLPIWWSISAQKVNRGFIDLERRNEPRGCGPCIMYGAKYRAFKSFEQTASRMAIQVSATRTKGSRL